MGEPLTQSQIDLLIELAKGAGLTPVEYLIEEMGLTKEAATELWERS